MERQARPLQRGPAEPSVAKFGIALLLLAAVVLLPVSPAIAEVNYGEWEVYHVVGSGYNIECAQSRSYISNETTTNYVNAYSDTLAMKGIFCPTFNPVGYADLIARGQIYKEGLGLCKGWSPWSYNDENTALITSPRHSEVVNACGHGMFYSYGHHGSSLQNNADFDYSNSGTVYE